MLEFRGKIAARRLTKKRRAMRTFLAVIFAFAVLTIVAALAAGFVRVASKHGEEIIADGEAIGGSASTKAASNGEYILIGEGGGEENAEVEPSQSNSEHLQEPEIDAANFTMFRGNPERNLSAVGTVPRRPKLLWRFRTKAKVEGPYEKRGAKNLPEDQLWLGLGWTGQPVMLDGSVYFGSADSYVYAIDMEQASLKWYYANHHCVKGSIAIFDDRIYHGGRDNKIHSYTLDGKMVWETRTGNDMDSSPVVVGGRGYIGGEDHYLYCFDPVSGEIIWKFGEVAGSIESSPCVAKNAVFFGTSRGYFYAVDKEAGKQLWRVETKGDTDSTPVFYDGKLYVGCATGDTNERGHFWCFSAGSGKVI